MRLKTDIRYSIFTVIVESENTVVTEDVTIDEQLKEDARDLVRDMYEYDNKGSRDVEFIKDLMEYYGVDKDDLIEELQDEEG